MPKSETTQARNAALLLHGLDPTSQQRIIAKLERSQVDRLKPLLDELIRLGVSPEVSQRLQYLASSPVAPAPAIGEMTAQERVKVLSAADVVSCLKHCAPVTVAQLLRAEAWPWRQQALDRMSELRRAEVVRHLRSESAPLAPAVLSSLCERLCLQATQLGGDRPQAGGVQDAPANRSRRIRRTDITRRLRRLIRWMR